MTRPLPGRGGSPGFRFTIYATLSIVLMFLDQRGDWLERARYFLNAAAYPLQLAVNSPVAAWQWIQESFETRASLQKENAELKHRQRELELRTMRYEALVRENSQLRGLKQALPSVAERWMVAEVISADPNNLRQRLVINRGTRNGVFKGQAVLDDRGVLGQTVRVGPWSAEVILVTDPEHAIPVQVERNGLRTIAVGAAGARIGTQYLGLPYLSANADIKPGDLLVTSGLGGVFPHGYPVARVEEVSRDAVQPLAQVRATPLAQLDREREVTLVWFRQGHPAAPGTDDEAKTGNPAFRPQAAPPPPAATASAAASPAPSASGSAAPPSENENATASGQAGNVAPPGGATPPAGDAAGNAAPGTDDAAGDIAEEEEVQE